MSEKFKKALRIAVNVGCGFEADAEDAAELLTLITGLESRIAELEAERRWIPVGERLPEHKPRDFYEVAFRFQEYPEVALWTGVGWVIFEDENEYDVSDSVVFWRSRQSLPDEIIATLRKSVQA